MVDGKGLLNQFIGDGSSFAKGAATGGLLGLLVGGKKTRKMAKTAATYGGVALVGGLAYKAWQNHKAGQQAQMQQPQMQQPQMQPMPQQHASQQQLHQQPAPQALPMPPARACACGLLLPAACPTCALMSSPGACWLSLSCARRSS